MVTGAAEKVRRILNCVCSEINKNINPRVINFYNYLEYEENTLKIDTEVLSQLQTYDSSLDYVSNINSTLKVIFNQDIKNSMALVQNEENLVEHLKAVEVNPATQKFQQEIRIDEEVLPAVQDASEILSTNRQDKATQHDESFAAEATNSVSVHTSTDSQIDLKSSQHFSASTKPIACDSNESLTIQRQAVLDSMFKEKTKKVARKLDIRYDFFAKNPSAHPKFREEWKTFYTEQSYRISSHGGKNVFDFNYLPAWNEYWMQRVKELKCQECLEHQSELRQSLFKENDMSDVTKKRVLLSMEQHRTAMLKLDDLSDISDDEIEFQTPKRMKIEHRGIEKVENESSSKSLPQQTDAEFDRMVIAYHIAYEHFREDKELTPHDLFKLVKLVEGEKCETENKKNRIGETRSVQQNDLTDDDLLMLYKNFRNLSQIEQDNYISYMKVIESSDPNRYKFLQDNMMKEDIQ